MMAQAMELRITNDLSQLPRVRDLVARAVRDGGFAPAYINRLQIAVEEAVTNIIEHGLADRPRGSAEILIEVEGAPERFAVAITDDGQSFDPASIGEVDITAHAATGRSGGLGVFLMRRIMDIVDYHAERGKGNRLVMVKHRPD
jgi:serine/threonine-protein kinase RsbW